MPLDELEELLELIDEQEYQWMYFQAFLQGVQLPPRRSPRELQEDVPEGMDIAEYQEKLGAVDRMRSMMTI